jgi:predicted regulator of Ras-like GTPase activity (Roadblock/LC7/MglB family)
VAAVLREISELRGRLPNITGALVVGDTGDPIAADLALGAERELAAQVAVSAAVGARLASTADVGLVTEVTVHGEDGYVALYPAGHRAALAVMTTQTVNLGRLHLQARHTAARIGAVLTHAENTSEPDAPA